MPELRRRARPRRSSSRNRIALGLGSAAASLLFGVLVGDVAHAAQDPTQVQALFGAPPSKTAGSTPKPDGPGKVPADKAQKKKDQQRISKQARDEARAHAYRQRSNTRRGKARRSSSIDDAKLPSFGHPSVQRKAPNDVGALVGWSGALDAPRFSDRRRRLPPAPPPSDFGHELNVGERFVFDVSLAGNPAGLAEAWVAAVEPDPRGGPPHGSPTVRLEGKAATSGIVSLLTTVTDHMTSIVDGKSGAAIQNVNVVRRNGLMADYKVRTTTIDFEGRGHVRVVDDKDGKTRKLTKHVPTDTLDPLGAMAWVRSLDLEKGEKVRAHVLDGKVLLRLEVVGRGKATLENMPSVASGLGIDAKNVKLIEGTATRVDKYDVPIPEKRPYTFRAWISNDGRGLLLALETDMWLGVLRLQLSRYDPPQKRDGPRADGPPDS